MAPNGYRAGWENSAYPCVCDPGLELLIPLPRATREMITWWIRPVSQPRKLTGNAFIEAFNGRLRAKCPNTHWFLTVEDARRKFENWRRDYNESPP